MSKAAMVDYERRWGEGSVDLHRYTLPALKASWVKNRLPVSSNTLLDYGCGEGKLIRTLKQSHPQLEVFGTDIQTPKNHSDFHFLLKKNDTEPLFEKKKFDVITSVDVLEHVDDMKICLSQINDHLNENGVGLFFIPTEGQLFSFYNLFRLIFGSDLYKKTKDHNTYTRKEIISLIKTQFEIKEINYAYHFFGSMLDATFFAACLVPSVSKWFWTKNTIYRPSEKKSLGSYAIEIANIVCYWESILLRKIPLCSSSVLIKVQKKAITL